MKKIYMTAAFAALALSILSCVKETESSMAPGTFIISSEDASIDVFSEDTEYKFIPVETNIPVSDWRFWVGAKNNPTDASGKEDQWCFAGPSITGAKGIMISVTANENPDLREAGVRVSAGSNQYDFVVTQAGYGPHIIVSGASADGVVFVSEKGGTVTLKVIANIPYTVSAPDPVDKEEGEWIKDITVKSALEESVYTYSVESNLSSGLRLAKVALSALNPSQASANVTVTITQNFSPEEPSEKIIGNAEKVYASAAHFVKDNQSKYYSWDAVLNWEKAGEPGTVIDGLMDTYCCSPRGLGKEGDNGTEFPFEIIFDFEDVPSMDYMKIYPINGNGDQISSFNAYYKLQGDTEWKAMNDAIAPYTCPVSAEAYTFMFDETLVKPASIKLEVLGTHWQLIKIAEVEFYKTNRQDTHDWILKVFTDLSCSELLPTVDKALINEMGKDVPYIAKNVAMPLLQGTYTAAQQEFRIQSYEAYSDPAAMKKAFNTRLYTELDSPTGIIVANKEILVVCVDKIPEGHTVTLAVNGKADSGYEFNYGTPQFSQLLREGVNVVPVSLSGGLDKGMVFIIHTDQALTPSSEAVKVHILPGSGTPQGYFHIDRHNDARLAEMLGKYTYDYFFLKGRRFILAAHKNELRQAVSTIGGYASGLAQLDNVVRWEKELMGLDESRHPEFNNHIMGVTTKAGGVHMDAADRRVRFGASAVGNYATEALVNASPWGIAHEIGHVNQPAICWESTIESSNNLFSNYVCMKCGVTQSRGASIPVRGESCGSPWLHLGINPEKYDPYQNENAELHMRMTWQLWNYFHRCGVKPDFWTRMFDIARANPTPGMYWKMYEDELGYKKEDPAICQMMFYEQACDAAELDLTDFFEAWGFFVPVDEIYGQYRDPGISFDLSEKTIEYYKNKVKEKGYPECHVAFQYIEDREIINGSSQRSDVAYGQDVAMGYYTMFRDKVAMGTDVPTYTISNRTVKLSNYKKAVAVEVYSADGKLQYYTNLSTFNVPEYTQDGNGDEIDLATAKFKAVEWNGTRHDMKRK